MPIKKPYTIRKLDPSEVPHLEDNVARLYAHKLEARYKYEGSSSESRAYIYNFVEYGQIGISANGSATVVRSVPLQERAERVLYVDAKAISTSVIVAVTDVTASSITIEARSISGTADFSSVTTATIAIYFQVVGSNPGN